MFITTTTTIMMQLLRVLLTVALVALGTARFYTWLNSGMIKIVFKNGGVVI